MSKLADFLKLNRAAANPANPGDEIRSFRKIRNEEHGKGEDSTTTGIAPNDPPPDPKLEARRREVLQMLCDNPGAKRAFLSSPSPEGGGLVTLAVRAIGTCELTIPSGAYDGVAIIQVFGDLGDSPDA